MDPCSYCQIDHDPDITCDDAGYPDRYHALLAWEKVEIIAVPVPKEDP